jgi:hypothetical protein
MASHGKCARGDKPLIERKEQEELAGEERDPRLSELTQALGKYYLLLLHLPYRPNGLHWPSDRALWHTGKCILWLDFHA